jgi:glycosyltransferase involved in cell wall biosynthesis
VSDPRPLKVLVLASYFPKPGNDIMGSWAISRVRGVQRAGMDVTVVSPTSWLPRLVGHLGLFPMWAFCPPEHDWNSLHVEYPRWLLYQKGWLKRQSFRNPWPQNRLAWLSIRGWLDRWIETNQPDVIWAQFAWINGFVARRLHDRVGVPYVVSEHDNDEIRLCSSHPARRRLYEHVYERASMVIATAGAMEADLRSLFPDARACTINNGIDPFPEALLDTPRPTERHDRKVLFSCGAFRPLKRMPLLIRAFDRVAERHDDVDLCIAGDGVERPAVERAIRQSRHGDRVALLGYIPHHKVLQEMAWADAFVLLSSPEAFGNVYLEAMSAGTPVVCCDDAGVNDVFVNGQHGYHVPKNDEQAAADAIDRLISDDALRTQMGAKARQLIEDGLSWDAYGRAFAEILHEAVIDRALRGR